MLAARRRSSRGATGVPRDLPTSVRPKAIVRLERGARMGARHRRHSTWGSNPRGEGTAPCLSSQAFRHLISIWAESVGRPERCGESQGRRSAPARGSSLDDSTTQLLPAVSWFALRTPERKPRSHLHEKVACPLFEAPLGDWLKRSEVEHPGFDGGFISRKMTTWRGGRTDGEGIEVSTRVS